MFLIFVEETCSVYVCLFLEDRCCLSRYLLFILLVESTCFFVEVVAVYNFCGRVTLFMVVEDKFCCLAYNTVECNIADLGSVLLGNALFSLTYNKAEVP